MSIEAMKQALEELKPFASTEVWDKLPASAKVAMLNIETALYKAIEQAEKQEPVAWIVDGGIKVRLDMAGKLYYSEANVYAAPVHASDISQERVDETAKGKHEWAMQKMVEENERLGLYNEPVAWIKKEELAYMSAVVGLGGIAWQTNLGLKPEAGDVPLYVAPPKREWVGLDNDIPSLGLVTEEFYNGMLCAEDILRKRNT